ncbi:MAG: FimB/Mfa2 family fimbrial subunit [Parabacteroides sp.]|nr:FimB/Mfa2 family fimbrial subunit [Parabacteroides sp.]
MKHIAIIKQSLILVAGLLAALLTSCIKDDLAECYKLTLKVERLNKDEALDITALGEVSDATLYIFDANKNFLESRNVDKEFITSRKEITLDNYPDNTKLYIVAWGNLGGGKQNITQPKNMDDLKVQLKSANGYAQSPDSLYYGSKEVTTLGSGVTGGNGEVVIRQKTGVYTIKTVDLEKGLKAYGLKSASDFDFYINETLDTYDNSGKLAGDSVAYNPEGQYDAAQEWLTTGVIDDSQFGGKQNSFAGENLGVRIISADGKIDKTVYVAEDSNGEFKPLAIPEAGRMDVLIAFGEDGSISARMRITRWGVVDDNIEF